MKASLWSDDEDDTTREKKLPNTSLFDVRDSKEKYKDLFESSCGGVAHNKEYLFSSSQVGGRDNGLFGSNKSDNENKTDELFGTKTVQTPRSSDRVNLFADDDDDDEDMLFVPRNDKTRPIVDLFSADDEDDQSTGDEKLHGGPHVIVDRPHATTHQAMHYKQLYEKEVAKCTQLELTVENLVEKVAMLECELRNAPTLHGEDKELEKSNKQASRQLRQKNRQKLAASRLQEKRIGASSDIRSGVVAEGSNSMSIENSEDNTLAEAFNFITDNSGSGSDSGDNHDEDEKVEHPSDVNLCAGDTATDTTAAVEETVEMNQPDIQKRVSRRQQQILARQQARSRGAASKMKSNKSKVVSSVGVNGEELEKGGVGSESGREGEGEGEGESVVAAMAVRRGSTGGLKYDGSGWQSSSSEDEDEDASESAAERPCTAVDPPSLPAPFSTVPSPPQQLDWDLEQEVDSAVCAWCSRQQNLITMIQSIPDIYSNDQLPSEYFRVDYSSSPSEVRRAYLKIARYCHPDKQKRLVNTGQSRRNQLIAEKLFSALADAYNAYKIQFDI